jgi:hypothetical protein
MNEHVLAAIVADDESEAFLGIEELHDALAFADHLGRHSAAAAATESTAAATAAETATVAAEASAATVAISPIRSEAPVEIAALHVSVFPEEPVALVPATTATVAFTPFVETHARKNSLCPNRL